MALGDLAGRARASWTNPVGMFECDRCRIWFNRTDARKQFQWGGSSLVDTGYLVCKGCLDVPQQQYRSLILPGDPVPFPNPRPSPDVTGAASAGQSPPTDPYNQGLTPFQVGGAPVAATPWAGSEGTPQSGGYPPGFPTSKAAVLAAVAAVSGVATPAQLFDVSTTFSAPNTPQQLVAAWPARTWLLLYSPAAPLACFSVSGSAILGTTTSLLIGPGQAWLMATSMGLGPCYTGAVSIAGLIVGMPLWAWQSSVPVEVMLDGYGNPVLDGDGGYVLL